MIEKKQNMADIFGDADLFTEFDKQRPASDEILKRKLDDEFRTHRTVGISNGSGSPGLYDTQAAEYDHRSYADKDAPLCCEKCGENTNFVHISKLKHLENEIHRLTTLNAELLKQNNLISLKRVPSVDEAPGLQVLFTNHNFSRKYKGDIEAYISKLIAREVTATHPSSVPRLPWRPNFVSFASSTYGSTKQPSDDKLVIGSCQFYNGFIVDPFGWTLIDFNPGLSDGWHIPTYHQAFSDALPCESEDEGAAAASVTCKPVKYERIKRSCFNCGGNHELSACNERRNMQRIDENRRQFQQRKQSAGNVPQTKQTSYAEFPTSEPLNAGAGYLPNAILASKATPPKN